MIHELIVTSVPRGLQAGRSGFTTVLRTRGIHPQVAEALERASGYRHVFPQGDARNPLIRSHTILSGATGTVSVLSRIADAGSDYSGRSNKLAHHIALDAGETAARGKSNPAAVLLALERSGGFQRQWTGEPREQPAGPQVPLVPSEPGVCQAWARLGGEAGWAGFLADRALARQPTWIIAPPGADLLELFAEALALVNYPQRWGVTFTTYALSAGDAIWLGTVEGSPEAQAARGQSRLAVVDLVRRVPLTSSSPMIEAARGAAAVPWKREAARPVAAVAQPGVPAAGPAVAGPVAAPGAAPPVLAPGAPPALAGGPPRLVPGMPLNAPTGGDLLVPAADALPGRRRGVSGGIIAALVVALLAIAGAIVTVVVRPDLLDALRGEREVAIQQNESSKDKPKTSRESKQTEQTEQPPVEVETGDGTTNDGDGKDRPDDEPEQSANSPAENPPPPDSGPSPDQRRRAAFTALTQRLDDARHLPAEKRSLDPADAKEQRLMLCAVAGVEVEPALPSLAPFNPVKDAGQWAINLEGNAPGPWTIVMHETQGGATAGRHELARVEQADGTLSLVLLALPDKPDEAEICRRGREALLTAPLLVKLPGEPNETSENYTNYVQLCQPKRLDPIRIERLLNRRKPNDKGPRYYPIGDNPGEKVIHEPLPATPWPCTVEMGGVVREGITATIAADPDLPKTIVDWHYPQPQTLTATWKWPDQDKKDIFMEQVFTLQNRAEDPTGLSGGELELQFTRSQVLERWSSWRRLGELKEISKAETKGMQVLPPDISAALDRVPELNESFSAGTLATFADLARQYLPPTNPLEKLKEQLRANSIPTTVMKPLAEWRAEMRKLIKHTSGYTEWVKQVAPEAGGEPNKEKDPDGHKEWAAKKERHARYAAAGDVEVQEYWKKLKGDLQAASQGPKAKRVGVVPGEAEAILCCLYDELEHLLEQKRKAKALLESVGSGDVEFTGRVWVDPLSDGKRRVLLAEFREATAAEKSAAEKAGGEQPAAAQADGVAGSGVAAAESE